MFSFRILLALFFIIPLAEIYLLIQVGGVIGAIPTVFLVVFTAVLGALLLRTQGFATIGRVQAALARGELPAMELLEGAMLLFGGALLLTPGFVTDTIGFVCLIPQLRRPLIRWVFKRGLMSASVGDGYSGPQSAPRSQSPSQPKEPQTLEGEFWEDKDRR